MPAITGIEYCMLEVISTSTTALLPNITNLLLTASKKKADTIVSLIGNVLVVVKLAREYIVTGLVESDSIRARTESRLKLIDIVPAVVLLGREKVEICVIVGRS